MSLSRTPFLVDLPRSARSSSQSEVDEAASLASPAEVATPSTATPPLLAGQRRTTTSLMEMALVSAAEEREDVVEEDRGEAEEEPGEVWRGEERRGWARAGGTETLWSSLVDSLAMLYIISDYDFRDFAALALALLRSSARRDSIRPTCQADQLVRGVRSPRVM